MSELRARVPKSREIASSESVKFSFIEALVPRFIQLLFDVFGELARV